MSLVLTLIGNAATALSAAHAETASAALPGAQSPVWLAPGLACDIAFDAPEGESSASHVRKLRALFAGVAIDLAVQPITDRRKKLLVADMDSTIIEQECIDELADHFGIGPRIAAITERAMRGEIDFEPALRERVGLLRGLPLAALEEVYRDRITETPGGRALIATMRAHGATCALVSGGFTFFTERVSAAVGFDSHQANQLVFRDGVLTGEVTDPILGRQAKIEALVALRTQLGLSAAETMAVGDGANDLGMIAEAGLGVAFHAKPVVAEAAGARIDHGDLTALLYLQGYRQSEISA